MKTISHLALLRVLVLIGATAWSLPSRADVAPSCDAFDALITCDAKDVGEACQGGGKCYAMPCNTNMTVYKCGACPTILVAPEAGCEPSGTCSSTTTYCPSSESQFVCAGPTPPQPTGPPAGESGGAGGGTGAGGGGGTGVAVCPSCKSNGGCDVAPRATGPGAIALGLLAAGMLALLYDRRRKRRR
jgi:hypothetical protein